IRDGHVTGVQTCALPIWTSSVQRIPVAVDANELAEIGTGDFKDQFMVKIIGLHQTCGWILQGPYHASKYAGHHLQAGRAVVRSRSEERRVGKEGVYRWGR